MSAVSWAQSSPAPRGPCTQMGLGQARARGRRRGERLYPPAGWPGSAAPHRALQPLPVRHPAPARCLPQVEVLPSLKALGRYVDPGQLTRDLDGTFPYCHSEWVQFFQVSTIMASSSPLFPPPPACFLVAPVLQ